MMTREERLNRWMDEAIIGLNLCPFARAPWQAGVVEVVWTMHSDHDPLYTDVMFALEALIDTPPDTIQTTLVIFEHGLQSFEEFLDFVDSVQYALDQSALGAVFQLATFHPNYLFDGEHEDDVSHYTNRAPWPVLHLLRQDDVTAAIQKHRDTLTIPEANIQRLDELGSEEVLQRWSRWMVQAHRDELV